MKIKKSCKAAVLLLLFSFIFLSGCGSGSDAGGENENTSEGFEASSSAEGEKTLVFGQTQTFTSLDPTIAYDSWMIERVGVGETLTRFDDSMQAEGWLAQDDFSLSEDGLTWTFTIRDDVNFSDGTKLTADLAMASILNVFENSDRASGFFEPDFISADGQILTIKTLSACPSLPGMLADPLFLIIDTTKDMSDIADTGPVCTGPFVYESYDAVTMDITVVKNENYWGGEVALDSVNFRQFSDTATMNLAMQSGELDVCYGMSPVDVANYESDDGYTFLKETGARTDWGFMNQNGLLSDKELRAALLECLDTETLCEVQLNGMYKKGNTPFPTEAYGVNELENPYTYDIDDAVSRLKAAGYEDTDSDGILENPDGELVVLEVYTYTTRAELPIICDALQSAALTLGIKININKVEDLWSTVIPSGGYDIAVLNSSAISTGDPEAFLKQYFSSGGVYNQYGYSNGKMDALIDALSATFDQDERNEIIKEISEILMEDACCAFYSYPMTSIISAKNITGLECTMADYYWMNANVDIN